MAYLEEESVHQCSCVVCFDGQGACWGVVLHTVGGHVEGCMAMDGERSDIHTEVAWDSSGRDSECVNCGTGVDDESNRAGGVD